METPHDRLDSWKEIAEYLGRDRTTVMRWERTAGLPVRRIRGERGMAVFALKSDLDQWLYRQPTMPDEPLAPPPPAAPAPKERRSWSVQTAAAAALVFSAGILVWRASASPHVSTAVLVGREIVAADASGHEVWRVPLPHIDGAIVPARFVVEDLDQDGSKEVVAALHFMTNGRRDEGLLMVLGANGTVRWQRTLEDRYRFGGVEYGPAWFPVDVAIYRHEGALRIAVAYHHHTWWPGLVVTFDRAGAPVARFVNAGWLTDLNVSADSRHLLAAGISNSFGGAILAVLDAARPSGVSPAGGSLPACANCPDGQPATYYVAPWTELARPSDTPPVMATVMPNGEIGWRAIQRGPALGKAPEVIVTLSSSFDVVDRSVNDFYRETRPGLEHWKPPVLQWTPSRGWRDATDPPVAGAKPTALR